MNHLVFFQLRKKSIRKIKYGSNNYYRYFISNSFVSFKSMNITLLTIGILLPIFIIFFVLKVKKKKQTQQKEHQKIREYGESLNNKTRNRK